MRILFMGSGDVACPALERLILAPGYDIVCVVSQPDRPKGRNRRVAACPAKSMAEARGVPVMTPERIGAPDAVEEIRALRPDIIVVAAYGQYIKPDILAIPPREAINIHPSLLPKYRGASPIQWAIANGESETGVTILYVSKEMDAGDIILQERYPIGEDDTAETLTPRLAERGADLLMTSLEAIQAGRATRTPQDPDQATYVNKLEKDDGRIDWSLPAVTIRNRIRGFTPWPGCFTHADGVLLKIRRADVEPMSGSAGARPGSIIQCDREGPVVATGVGALRLLEVQPEGKNVMTGAAYLCGHALGPGATLG